MRWWAGLEGKRFALLLFVVMPGLCMSALSLSLYAAALFEYDRHTHSRDIRRRASSPSQTKTDEE